MDLHQKYCIDPINLNDTVTDYTTNFNFFILQTFT